MLLQDKHLEENQQLHVILCCIIHVSDINAVCVCVCDHTCLIRPLTVKGVFQFAVV